MPPISLRAAQIADLSGAYGTIQHAIVKAKVQKYGLTRLYGTAMVYRVVNGTGQMVPDTQALSPLTLKYVTSAPPYGLGVEYGIVRDPTWTNLDAPSLAAALEQDLRSLGIPASGHTGASALCAVLADAEAHTFDIVGFLAAWRKLRPARETGWTIEGFQEGRISDTQIAAIQADPNLVVYGQAYRGSMYPLAQDQVRLDLEARLARERVSVVYDGQLGAPDRMDGITYTLERLP